MKYSQNMIWSILFPLLLAGCSALAAASTPTPLPSTETPTPTSNPKPAPDADLIEVTFDGSECALTELTELTKGEHSFVLFDRSETNQELWIAHYIYGKTWQDVLNLQNIPGEYFPKPGWAVHPPLLYNSWDDSRGGKVYTFKFQVEGEYGIAVGTVDPPSLWLCGPFQVVGASPE